MFPLLFDQLADSVFVTDADGTIQYVNHAFELTTGFSRKEAVGQTPRILKSGIHPRAVYDELWATIRGGTPFRFIFGNRTKSGEIYEEGVMISPIRGPDGKTTHYLSMGRVINAFRQNYDVFTLLANTAPAAIYLQRDGRIFFVNEHLTAALGYSPEELLGREWLELIVSEDRGSAAAGIAAMLGGATEAPFEYRVVAKDGNVRWLMATVRRVVFRGIQAVAGDFVAGYLTDITDRKDAEDRLQKALSLYAATIESTTDGIIVLDNDRQLVSHNRLFTDMWKLGDVINRGAFTTRAVLAEQMKNGDAFKRTVEEAWADPMSEKGGTVELLDGRHMEFYSKPQIVDGRVIGRVWSWRDVTERRQFEAALLRLANYDSVTGLYSRPKFQEEVRQSLAAHPASPAALLLLDLDGFKSVNDTYGHQAGDQVLIQVGMVLAGSGCGELIGRFGGDEFAIFLPGCDQVEATAAAQRAIQAISRRPYMAAGAEVSLTASVGVAVYPDSGKNADELLSAADLAMYEAKDSGRGNVHLYSPRLRQLSRLNLRGDWQAQIRHAIANRLGRLYAEEATALERGLSGFYKLSLRLAGQRGKAPTLLDFGKPGDLAGIAVLRDRWLADEALAFSRQLSDSGNAMGLSLDVNAESLADPKVVARLMMLANLHPRSKGPLLLGFTEVGALPTARAAVRRLHEAGFSIAVGGCTPQRMFEVMQTVPVGAIAIDATLVARVARDQNARSLAAGLVRLADAIGARTVASGVANAVTLEALRELGVDYARGGHIGRARATAGLFKRSASIAA
jgi:diguanylate cyclase (GGDEF)-like protein/PAS domain S-box-containing protein